jgi:hypothetical protein
MEKPGSHRARPQLCISCLIPPKSQPEDAQLGTQTVIPKLRQHNEYFESHKYIRFSWSSHDRAAEKGSSECINGGTLHSLPLTDIPALASFQPFFKKSFCIFLGISGVR